MHPGYFKDQLDEELDQMSDQVDLTDDDFAQPDPFIRQDLNTSLGRYLYRRQLWAKSNKSFWWLRHWFWWIFHNMFAHVFVGLVPCVWTIKFHDWTSMRLNMNPKIIPSSMPVISSYPLWILHNVLSHLLIGLFPFKRFFNFHDETSKLMDVEGWV